MRVHPWLEVTVIFPNVDFDILSLQYILYVVHEKAKLGKGLIIKTI
jgi:hypothetical protein